MPVTKKPRREWSIALFGAIFLLTAIVAKSLLISVLSSAASIGNTSLVQTILWIGIPPDACDSAEAPITPLMSAAQNGRVETVKILVLRGADVNYIGFQGYSPLISASVSGDRGIVRLLIEQGADVNARTTNSGDTALTIAISNGHTEAVRVLINNGANMQVRTAGTNSALDCAITNKHKGIIEILKAAGAKR